MAYKIAVASTDGLQIDETFGAAKSFLIYEVENGKYHRLEERFFDGEGSLLGQCGTQACNGKDAENADNAENSHNAEYAYNAEKAEDARNAHGETGGCGSGAKAGCGSGCGGDASAKVELVADCRCIVCKKIGFQIQKQLERKAISAFDVSCSVEEALSKISNYFTRMDNHESLRVQK